MIHGNFEILQGYKLRKKVRALVINDRAKFLLIQPHSYESDAWTLVGGGVEEGEDYEKAIKREMLEETGIAETKNLLLSKEIHWFCFSDNIKTKRNLDYDGQIARIFWASVPYADVKNSAGRSKGFLLGWCRRSRKINQSSCTKRTLPESL